MDIHGTARAGADEELQRIVDSGADVNEPDKLKRTALHMAAWAGKKSSMLILLSGGANVHALAADNMTPLIFAAQNGHTDCCEALLRKKANVNHKISKGRKTALHFAVQKKHTGVVELLVRKGADKKVHAAALWHCMTDRECSAKEVTVEPEKKKQHQQAKMTADEKRAAARKRNLCCAGEDEEDTKKKPKVALDHLEEPAAQAGLVEESALRQFAEGAGLEWDTLDEETILELTKLYQMQQQATALEAQLAEAPTEESNDNTAAAAPEAQLAEAPTEESNDNTAAAAE